MGTCHRVQDNIDVKVIVDTAIACIVQPFDSCLPIIYVNMAKSKLNKG